MPYEELGDTLRADSAYIHTIELESGLSQRGALIYNTYGYFLYRQRKYDEAIPCLKQALKIDPSHPKAKSTLAAARTRSAEAGGDIE